jgi:isocitrate lyase
MFDLAWNYARNGMSAFVKVQEREFEMEREMGFRAVKHQSFVGAGYFDSVQTTVTGGEVSTAAMRGSTEEQQFSRDGNGAHEKSSPAASGQ